MIAVDYRCSCGHAGEMVEMTISRPDQSYPEQQYFIECGACGSRTFRFDSPQASEMNWAAMEAHTVEYSGDQYAVA